ncbi:heterokaryon incompatibility, partial [Leptodontidium sp. 2 PMI_412]
HFSLASLEDPQPYEALSYVWGDNGSQKKIFIDGIPFAITPTLHAALENLRLEYDERILWIDALCINQANEHERTNQVSCMGRIYRQAVVVVV